MTYDPNDPRWTAYALGELDDEARADLDAVLEDDPKAREAFEDIQSIAALLADELSAEPAPGLTEAQHQELEEEMAQASASSEAPQHEAKILRPNFSRMAVIGSLLAAAAAVLLIFGPFALMGQGDKEAPGERSASGITQQDEGYFHGRDDQKAGSEKAADPGEKPVELVVVDNSTAIKNPEPQNQPNQPTVPAIVSPVSNNTKLRVASSPSPARIAANKDSKPKAFAFSASGKTGGKKQITVTRPGYRQDGLVATKEGETFEIKPELVEELKAMGYVDSGVVGHRGWNSGRGESYNPIVDNDFESVINKPLSTFSIDVDTASYANVRRFLTRNALPPADAVRIEELINYFDYDYAPPSDGEAPFAVHTEVTACPWEPEHRLLRVGLKGKVIDRGQRPSSNFVFLLDVSGSMSDVNKLPLLKRSLKLLTEQLTENDRVAIVVYAGASGLVLPSTTGNRRSEIMGAMERLHAGGSTNGGAGIELAYAVATQHFIPGGTNRVILATDGDFNVGTTGRKGLERLIQKKAASGVFLSVLGFGMGNLNDNTLENLSNKGNGNYAYIDNIREARKVLVEQMSGTLVTIAKDVKIQVEFNPGKVQGYRLIGYANRMLKAEDFNNDKKDAGEIGAGHTVTALYEIVPAGRGGAKGVDALKYQPKPVAEGPVNPELLTVKLRYKKPDGDRSRLLEFPVVDQGLALDKASSETQFAASVAAFGMLLRQSKHRGAATWPSVIELADVGKRQRDPHGYRAEFLTLARKAKTLSKP